MFLHSAPAPIYSGPAPHPPSLTHTLAPCRPAKESTCPARLRDRTRDARIGRGGGRVGRPAARVPGPHAVRGRPEALRRPVRIYDKVRPDHAGCERGWRSCATKLSYILYFLNIWRPISFRGLGGRCDARNLFYNQYLKCILQQLLRSRQLVIKQTNQHILLRRQYNKRLIRKPRHKPIHSLLSFWVVVPCVISS